MKHFSIFFRLITVILITNSSIAQKSHKPFIGFLQYKITPVDTNLNTLYPEEKMTIYTNDTVVRIEMDSPKLGKQVTIRHMQLRKAYLLIHSPFGKYAIQRDFAKEDTILFNADSSIYQIEKKSCSKRIQEKKANRLKVTIKGEDETFEWLYFKKYSTQIINAFEHQINGLPVLYNIKTPDVLLKYELVKMKENTPEKRLFLIPNEYKTISFQDFVQLVTDEQTIPAKPND